MNFPSHNSVFVISKIMWAFNLPTSSEWHILLYVSFPTCRSLSHCCLVGRLWCSSSLQFQRIVLFESQCTSLWKLFPGRFKYAYGIWRVARFHQNPTIRSYPHKQRKNFENKSRHWCVIRKHTKKNSSNWVTLLFKFVKQTTINLKMLSWWLILQLQLHEK